MSIKRRKLARPRPGAAEPAPTDASADAAHQDRRTKPSAEGMAKTGNSSSKSKNILVGVGALALVATVATVVARNYAPMGTPPKPTDPPSPPRAARWGSYELLAMIPHDSDAFTQGLFVWNGSMYEGTGNYGASSVRIVDPADGTVRRQADLEPALFGEGIAHFPGADGTTRIVQLTYQEQTGIVWDMNLNRLHNFTFETVTSEGWGVTYAPPHGLLISDGSEWLQVWDPAAPERRKVALEEARRIHVQLLHPDADEPRPLPRINEMEWDHHSNTLLANVWTQVVLVRIDADSGYVLNVYDLRQLWPDRPRHVDVFNGVAVTDEPGVVWVTGKWWPHMYKVRLID